MIDLALTSLCEVQFGWRHQRCMTITSLRHRSVATPPPRRIGAIDNTNMVTRMCVMYVVAHTRTRYICMFCVKLYFMRTNMAHKMAIHKMVMKKSVRQNCVLKQKLCRYACILCTSAHVIYLYMYFVCVSM